MTEENDFIENFPSLRGKGLHDYPDIDSTVGSDGLPEDKVVCYLKKDIQEHCLDRQKVREEIDTIYMPDTIRVQLKERLGL